MPSTHPSCSNNTGARGEAAGPPADGEEWTDGRLGPKGVPGGAGGCLASGALLLGSQLLKK